MPRTAAQTSDRLVNSGRNQKKTAPTSARDSNGVSTRRQRGVLLGGRAGGACGATAVTAGAPSGRGCRPGGGGGGAPPPPLWTPAASSSRRGGAGAGGG